MRAGEGGHGCVASPSGGVKPLLAFRIAFGNENLFRGQATNIGLVCLRPESFLLAVMHEAKLLLRDFSRRSE